MKDGMPKRIIDAHIHFSNIKSFKDVSRKSKVDYSLKGFNNEFKDIIAIGMGVTETIDTFPDSNSPNPMTLDLDVIPSNLYTCLGYNPNQDKNIKEFEKLITNKEAKVVGLKIYAGYYHYHVWDDIYRPVYELASKYDLPVVIHSGNTFSEKGLLKYAHPLEIDQLAVMYSDVKFVIAHFGDPWIMDAAEVASKNKNVYIDLSGWIVGDETDVDRFKKDEFTFRLKQALVYLDNYKKVLFGTDWPLVNLESYLQFIIELIPIEHREDVFYGNAAKFFKI